MEPTMHPKDEETVPLKPLVERQSDMIDHLTTRTQEMTDEIIALKEDNAFKAKMIRDLDLKVDAHVYQIEKATKFAQEKMQENIKIKTQLDTTGDIFEKFVEKILDSKRY